MVIEFIYPSDDAGNPNESHSLQPDELIYNLSHNNDPLHPLWYTATNLCSSDSKGTTTLSSTVVGGGVSRSIWVHRIGSAIPGGLTTTNIGCTNDENVSILMHRIDLHFGHRIDTYAVFVSDAEGNPDESRTIEFNDMVAPLCDENSYQRLLWYRANNISTNN